MVIINGMRFSYLRGTLLLFLCQIFCTPAFAWEALPSEKLQKIQIPGAELHYVISGKGQPVLFVHGGLVDYREFQPVAAGLQGQYQTIVYSRRYNFPNKNEDVLTDFSAATEAEDLAALIQGLKLKDLTVVGASYGAYTSLMLALRRPDTVKRLVLVEPPLLEWLQDIPGGPAVFADFQKRCFIPVGKALKEDQADAAIKIVLEFFVGPGAMEKAPPDFVELIRANLKEWKVLTASTNVFPAISREEVRSIRQPTLMLSGGNTYAIGKLIDPEIEKELPNVHRVAIPGGTHDVCAELPESCSAEILKFLTKRE